MAAKRNTEHYGIIETQITEGRSIAEVAKFLGINTNSVRRIVSKLGLVVTNKDKNVVSIEDDQISDICGRYESGESASSIAVSYGVNTGRITKILKSNNVSIRDTKSGVNHPMWNGGKGLKCGRWVVYSPEHPRAMNNGRVWEHVIIMENHLGRSITAAEPIHHIDIDPLNNDVDNLHLCKDDSEHRRIHTQLEKITKELIGLGVLSFDREEAKYIINRDKLK